MGKVVKALKIAGKGLLGLTPTGTRLFNAGSRTVRRALDYGGSVARKAWKGLKHRGRAARHEWKYASDRGSISLGHAEPEVPTAHPTPKAHAKPESGPAHVAPDPGPGAYVRVNESMSARARAYQKQIVGGHEGEAYLLNGVKFDGFKDGVLLDAKGLRYAHFIKDGEFRSWYRGGRKMIKEAKDQVRAAGDSPIRWCFAEEEAADFYRAIFERERIKIEVVHVPFLK
jgi:hypothetical protein